MLSGSLPTPSVVLPVLPEAEKQSVRVQDQSFVALVKLDHMIYKQRTYLSLNSGGDGQHTGAVEVTHEDCRLGRWCQADGEALLASCPPSATPDRPMPRFMAVPIGCWSCSRRDGRTMSAFRAASSIRSAKWRKPAMVMKLLDHMVLEKHPAEL